MSDHDGRDERFAQRHREIVAPLGHVADANGHPAFGHFAFGQQAHAKLRVLDRSRIACNGILVGDVLINHAVASQRTRVVIKRDFLGARAIHRQAKRNALALQRFRNINGLRWRVVFRKRERRAIGHDAITTRDCDLANGQRGFIQLQMVEAPKVPFATQPALVLRILAVALTLLKMLWTKEHALRPDNPTAITHLLSPISLKRLDDFDILFDRLFVILGFFLEFCDYFCVT